MGPPRRQPGWSRRSLLFAGAAAAGATFAGPFEVLAKAGKWIGPSPEYGPLAPVPDDATGLPLLSLPAGFRYVSFSWTGDPMEDGSPTPARHDGGAALRGPSGRVHYVRNHELQFPAAPRRSFAPAGSSWDPGGAPGGTTTVMFDPEQGSHLGTYPSLSGTVRNCAGGPTPWNTWLSCEETLVSPGGAAGLQRTHGWVFEVPATGPADPTPLVDLGRFVHEAAAVDPETGFVYLTEDRNISGLYRFVPDHYGRLRDGGRLEMLRIPGLPVFNTGTGLASGSTFEVDWVPIDAPAQGPILQGLSQGGAFFRRGEGLWHGSGRIHFTCTSAGAAGAGQVWALDPRRDLLKLLFESPGATLLDRPDNVTISPQGSVLLCEDGARPNFLRGLTRRGEIFDFARNDMVLPSSPNGVVAPGDYRFSELAGASFDAEGKWLFVNVQTPGVTLAITGPWESGPL